MIFIKQKCRTFAGFNFPVFPMLWVFFYIILNWISLGLVNQYVLRDVVCNHFQIFYRKKQINRWIISICQELCKILFLQSVPSTIIYKLTLIVDIYLDTVTHTRVNRACSPVMRWMSHWLPATDCNSLHFFTGLFLPFTGNISPSYSTWLNGTFQTLLT